MIQNQLYQPKTKIHMTSIHTALEGILHMCVDEQSSCNCFVLMTEVSQLTPLLVGLPILRQPKEGAVDSTFNEQSPCSAGTASCWVDGASVDLIM